MQEGTGLGHRSWDPGVNGGNWIRRSFQKHPSSALSPRGESVWGEMGNGLVSLTSNAEGSATIGLSSHMCVHTHTNMHTYTCTCTHTHTHACTGTRTQRCAHTHTCIHMHTQTQVYGYALTCTLGLFTHGPLVEMAPNTCNLT